MTSVRGGRYGRAIDVVLLVGALLAIVGSFGTWLRSGARTRSSFEVFELIDRLGFDPDGAYGWALRAWPLMPVVVVTAVVLWWVAGPRWGVIVLALVAAVYALGIVYGVLQAPRSSLITIGSGPTVTALGAGMMLAAVVAATVERAVSRRRRATGRALRAPHGASLADRS